jgi:hypothetical protein
MRIDSFVSIGSGAPTAGGFSCDAAGKQKPLRNSLAVCRRIIDVKRRVHRLSAAVAGL